MFLGNMRQRGGIILAIVLSAPPVALVIWLTWSAVAALCIYAGAILAAAALLLLSIRQTPRTGTAPDPGEEDDADT